MKFYAFRQNNSGGYFIVNDDVAITIVIEADSQEDASKRLYEITEDYSEYCSCCGERWSDYFPDEGDESLIYEERTSFFGNSVIAYRADGTKEKYNYAEDER